jgi:glycosyltransferase involved in cell wall biosynthesis
VRRTRLSGKALLRGWQYLNWPPMERFTGPLDLAHSPASYVFPARAARRVVTIHDVYFKYAPEHVDTYGGEYFLKTFDRKLPRVDHIIAISEFTRGEILKFYPIDPARISVVPHAVDLGRFSPEPREGDADVLGKLGIEPPFLLCVATIEPRKNLITLIEAYARMRQILRAGGQKPPHLVITGQPAWGIRALEARVKEASLQNIVKLTGYLEDEMIPPLYRQALGFVFPSVYEGFGMPALEAMACGCPAAVSQAASLPEVAGEAALYFNPRDSDSMARVLTQFITEPHLRSDLREAGLRRAKLFTWDATARGVIEVYRHVLEAPANRPSAAALAAAR